MYTPKQCFITPTAKVWLGFWVRGSIYNKYNYKYTRKNGRPGLVGRSYKPGTTFRVQRRPNNLNTRCCSLVQTQFPGVVPSSINNPEGQPSRDKFKAAILAWQALPETDKKTWHKKSIDDKYHTGYNLFVQNYLLTP